MCQMDNAKHFQKRIFDFLTESQFWPTSSMQLHQQGQLRQLLRFARDNVPFYTNRLNAVFNKSGEIDFHRWREIPVLHRADLLHHRESMLATVIPPGHGEVSDTEGSGTTGMPVTTRHNYLTHLASQAAVFRAYDWHKVDYGGVFVQWMGNDADVAAWPDGMAKGPWGPSWHPNAINGMFWQINRATSPEDVAEFLSRKQADYFSGRPKSLQSVALAAERLKLPVQLRALSGFSTAAREQERADCRRVFGAEMIMLYASKEVYNIAHQCPQNDHFHVNTELLMLEVLDDNDNPVPAGTRGRAVITSFYNTAQPFIRYNLGDQIVMDDRPCRCGCTLPVIARIEGRTTHLFRFPDGRKTAPSIPPHFRALIGAVTWQMAQVAPLTIEVRYLKDGSKMKPDFDGFTREVRLRTDPNVHVTYVTVAELPLTPSGKFIEYVCELPPET